MQSKRANEVRGAFPLRLALLAPLVVLFIFIGLPILYEIFDFGISYRQFARATHPFVVLNWTIERLGSSAFSARSGVQYPAGEVYTMLAYYTVIYGLGTLGLFYAAVRGANARLMRDR